MSLHFNRNKKIILPSEFKFEIWQTPPPPPPLHLASRTEENLTTNKCTFRLFFKLKIRVYLLLWHYQTRSENILKQEYFLIIYGIIHRLQELIVAPSSHSKWSGRSSVRRVVWRTRTCALRSVLAWWPIRRRSILARRALGWWLWTVPPLASNILRCLRQSTSSIRDGSWTPHEQSGHLKFKVAISYVPTIKTVWLIVTTNDS